MCVCYLAACGGVMAPVIFYTLIAGLSLCVGGADALSILRVTVPTSVITGACWEEKISQLETEMSTNQHEDL